ncbi:MAG: NAD-dependent epimerase/dehydratase family protein [Actinomycetia bacterium]|nr:NAD-dependent epimerase/dehydratase family protein [Actinomycetes bacterium]
MPHGKRALVTGGAGFIGSHVTDALSASGYDVLVVDDLTGGTPDNVGDSTALEVLDIRDLDALVRVSKTFAPTVVCHLAAQPSVTASVRDPRHDLTTNVLGTLNVLEAARTVSAPTTFASTGGALYGDEAPIPTREDCPPRPLSPYGASKLCGEAYVATWSRLHRLPNVILRLANVYGPRQDAHGEAGVVAIFSKLLLQNAAPTVFGDGTQTRDYTHVHDTADAFVRAAQASSGGTFNVGTGIETSVLALLGHLQEAAGTTIEPRFAALRPGELPRSALDASAIGGSLGWVAQMDAARGLADTLRTYATR